MIRRMVSAAILIPPVLAAIWIGSPYFNILLLIAGLAAIFEWCRIAAGGHAGRLGYAAICILAAVLILFSFRQFALSWMVMAFGLLGLILFGWRRAGESNPWPAIGLFYIAAACIALAVLRGDQAEGRRIILWLFLVVWATDIGAYAFGRWIGGARLAPALSPNNTWAGLVGGMIAAGIGGAVTATTLDWPNTPGVILFSISLAVISQGGDLMESAIKRAFKVKDSGNLIPGHGGLLDRLDGFMTAAPSVAAVALLGGEGVLAWH